MLALVFVLTEECLKFSGYSWLEKLLLIRKLLLIANLQIAKALANLLSKKSLITKRKTSLCANITEFITFSFTDIK